jgi:hypothetical protein
VGLACVHPGWRADAVFDEDLGTARQSNAKRPVDVASCDRGGGLDGLTDR